MNLASIIFADTYGVDLDSLTKKRNLAAVPFGARYRLIDFVLSSMSNSGIRNIGIVAQKSYRSMMDHVRSGSEWDLERKRSALTVLTPFAAWREKDVYKNRLTGLAANISYLEHLKEKYILIAGCNTVMNIDYSKVLDAHIKSGARVTGIYTKEPRNAQKGINVTSIRVTRDGLVSDIDITTEVDLEPGWYLSSGAFIIGREDLISCIEDAVAKKKESLRKDVLTQMAEDGEIRAYETKDMVLYMDSTSGYLQSNLDLLNLDVRENIFASENGPVITVAQDSAPTRYGEDAEVTNSLVADGAIIEGTVKNSIIYRGVHIKKGAVVENSVVLENSVISEGARINYAVLDKKCFIEEDRILSGYITHPFVVEKGSRI